MVSGSLVHFATFYHTKVGKIILIVLVMLHVSAIAFYRVKRGENLVRPMLNGDKELAEPFEGSQDDAGSRIKALLLFGICVGCVAALVQWAA